MNGVTLPYRRLSLLVLALILGGTAVLSQSDRSAAFANTIAIPEAPGIDGGTYISLAVDSPGRAVLSHYDRTTQDLKVLRCGDGACMSGNTTAFPDLSGHDVGRYSALVLDFADTPVIAYQDATAGALKLVRCGNNRCTAGNTFSTPDAASAGYNNDIALDAANYPVVSYSNVSGDLKLLHCGDQSCSAGNSIATPAAAVVGGPTALALDGAGNPVVAYYDSSISRLRVLHCGNANCTAGNTFATPDTSGNVGIDPSLALDADGYPVISYGDASGGHLKVLHCGNADCTAGNSIVTPDPLDGGAEFTSIALDAAGYPVVAYHDIGLHTLKVLHCADPNCNVVSYAAAPDPTGDPFNDVGWYASMALDAFGQPFVGYKYNNAGQLRVVHCGNQLCTKPKAGPVGDANCDLLVNSIDAALILQAGAALVPDVPCPLEADVNRNGGIDAVDAALVLQYIAGLLAHLPP